MKAFLARLLTLPRGQKRWLMVGADLLLLPGALWAAYVLRFAEVLPDPALQVWWLFPATALLGILIFSRLGLYRTVVRFMGMRAIWLVAAGVALLAAPLLEEIVFRGLVHNALARVLGPHRRWGIILLSAVIFTLIHLGAVLPYALGSLFMLAIVLGWLYERTGSLWPPIVVHFLFNALNTIMAWQVDLEMPVPS